MFCSNRHRQYTFQMSVNLHPQQLVLFSCKFKEAKEFDKGLVCNILSIEARSHKDLAELLRYNFKLHDFSQAVKCEEGDIVMFPRAKLSTWPVASAPFLPAYLASHGTRGEGAGRKTIVQCVLW